MGCLRRSASSSSSQDATSRIIERVVSLINEDVGGKAVDVERVESALRESQTFVLARGKQVDMQPFLAAASERVVSSALTAVRNSLRDQKLDVDKIVLVGGGADLFADKVKEVFGEDLVVVAEDSVLANARGYWRYAINYGRS